MNRHPPSNYGDEPPAYDHEATSFLSHDDSPTTTPRHNGPSMRLLPTSSNVESDMSRSYRSASPSQYSQLQSEYPETIPYVSLHFPVLLIFCCFFLLNGLPFGAIHCNFIPRHIPVVAVTTSPYPLVYLCIPLPWLKCMAQTSA